jgi:putative transposase
MTNEARQRIAPFQGSGRLDHPMSQVDRPFRAGDGRRRRASQPTHADKDIVLTPFANLPVRDTFERRESNFIIILRRAPKGRNTLGARTGECDVSALKGRNISQVITSSDSPIHQECKHPLEKLDSDVIIILPQAPKGRNTLGARSGQCDVSALKGRNISQESTSSGYQIRLENIRPFSNRDGNDVTILAPAWRRYNAVALGQSLVKNYIHIIFSTKGREPLIHPSIENELYSYLGGICNNMECTPIKIGGHYDHVHILCFLSKKIALMKLVEELKSHSSSWMKTKDFCLKNFYWQNGYGAFSVKPSEVGIVKSYIENQHVHHSKKIFQDEYRELLKMYDVGYDERYVWD